MQSCDDCLVSGKRNSPNLYDFVIKTVTECIVFLNMILRNYYCITSSMTHYHFVVSTEFVVLYWQKERSFSLVRDTKSEVLHVPVWTQFYDLGLNAQVDVRI